MAAAFIMPYAVPEANFHDDRGLVFGIGVAIFCCGVAVRWWAIRTLGEYFTFSVMTSRDQPIVTTGPYRYVRHPGYTGGTVSRFGLGLALGNWLSLVVVVLVPLIGTIYRIRVEEAALLESLGDDYQAYADAHKRLIPFRVVSCGGRMRAQEPLTSGTQNRSNQSHPAASAKG